MSFNEPNLNTRVPATIPITGGKIAIVGEAPGETEIKKRKPFVGNAGLELGAELTKAAILRSECYLTNVFDFKLPGNDITSICGKKATVGGRDYHHPPLSSGNYLRPEYLSSLSRLREELTAWAPNVVVALGNTALWALCGHGQVGKYRGAVAESSLVPGLKVIPTYHPAAVLRNWSFRAICIVDLMKAKRESEFSEIRRPKRALWIEPTLQDLDAFARLFMDTPTLLSVDIETARNTYITCIGFAPSATVGICVPFVDKKKKGFHYWDTPEEEACALRWCKSWLEDPAYPILGQNFGGYDIQWLLRKAGIKTQNYAEDTMQKWHSIQPEMPKDLGFLTALFSRETAHKVFNPNVGKERGKRED